MVSIIAAIALNRAIGLENKLLYWLPEDLKRFKSLTTGHTIIMGRKTYESLPKGALPNRRNIVLSRQPQRAYPCTEVYHSLDEALGHCSKEEVFIIGGESVYREALTFCDRLYLTEIEDLPAHADAFFPSFALDEWELVQIQQYQADEKNKFNYAFKDYKRKRQVTP
ncbi:MAG: dihydrofolate reductase [Paraprevotella sp.]|nr:dihydrofolate reductase [Paraprevotella sp.]